jgi:hypothetical protein
MKTITIGDKTYKLAENAEDLSLKRYTQLKEYLLHKETGVPLPSLSDAIRGFIKGFDTNSKAEMLISLHNYFSGIKSVESMEDADQLIFSVICYEDGEDVLLYDKTQAKEKLKRMNSAGLKQGEVTKAVNDFIEGSPLLSSLYFLKSLQSLKD